MPYPDDEPRGYHRPDDVCPLHGRWLSRPEHDAGACSSCTAEAAGSAAAADAWLRDPSATTSREPLACVDCGAGLPIGNRYRCEPCIGRVKRTLR